MWSRRQVAMWGKATSRRDSQCFWLYRLLAVAVVVASPFVLANDFGNPPWDLVRDALTLLALVLVAEWVHVLFPGAFRLALLSLAAVASVLIVFDLPAALTKTAGGPTTTAATTTTTVVNTTTVAVSTTTVVVTTTVAVTTAVAAVTTTAADTTTTTTDASGEPTGTSSSGAWLIQILAAAILLVLLGKLVLLHRLALIAGGREFRRQADPSRLLPGQRRDLYDLCNAAVRPRPDDPGQLVQLIGRWGEGKSFVVHHLVSYLADPPYLQDQEPLGDELEDVATAVVDVWKHETEPDLHLALIEEVLSEPRFLLRFGWLRAPLSILIGRYVRNGLIRLSLGSQKLLAAEVPFKPPRLPWQRSYERLVGHARRRGRRTIIVLDEIDRCSPAMAQRTISMTRRSLDLPGVTVVLCYVDSLIRYKAFNPLVDDVLADLGSTMEAVIFASQIRSTQGSWAPNSIRSWWSSRGSPSNVPPTATYDANKGAETDQPALATALKRAYEGESLTARYQLEEKFADKYLGTHPIRMRRLSHEDVATMVTTWAALRPLAESLIEPGRLDEAAAAIPAALAASWQAMGVGDPPAVRRLLAVLVDLLEAYVRAAQGPPQLIALPVSVPFFTSVVVHGYHRART